MQLNWINWWRKTKTNVIEITIPSTMREREEWRFRWTFSINWSHLWGKMIAVKCDFNISINLSSKINSIYKILLCNHWFSCCRSLSIASHAQKLFCFSQLFIITIHIHFFPISFFFLYLFLKIDWIFSTGRNELQRAFEWNGIFDQHRF